MKHALRRMAFGVLLMVVLAGPSWVFAADSSAPAAKEPWYHNTSTIISITALMFSFGTTFVSYRRTEKQDIQAARTELRGILQRLSAIPRENLEAAKKNAGDPSAIAGISTLYNQESSMLTRQAAEIVNRLPKGLVSATEYYAIGIAFQSAYNLNSAKDFLSRAWQASNNFNDEIGAIRSSANLDFIAGRPEDGRVLFQQALGIFTKYPGYDPYTVASTHIFTEIYWAYAEGNMSQFQLSAQHIDNAQRIVDTLPPSQGSDGLKAQIQQARDQLSRAMSTGVPAPSTGQGWVPHPSA
jgi:tetratricopeptide (TPR) repeat protein